MHICVYTYIHIFSLHIYTDRYMYAPRMDLRGGHIVGVVVSIGRLNADQDDDVIWMLPPLIDS